jgi:hypothetical protein
MKRCPLVPLLIAMQLLSWSGPAVYLCWSDDGSFGIDAGPQHCQRCHHHADLATDYCEPSQVHGDCDCTHLLLSQQQLPTTIHRCGTQNYPLDNGMVGFLSIDSPHLTAATTIETALAGPHLAGHNSSLAASLATIMLRC